MVFLVLFAVKTGLFMGTDSLSWVTEKKLEREKEEARLS